ncbi:MAG TPA: MASE3 domain-containing protein, partial [Anaeromyxobacter sp.]|nr:MASE3 domain-containing protein [Anaeromyxobacter sp.]
MGTATMEPPRGAGGERVAALRGSTPRWWLVLLAAPAAALLLLEVAGITIEVPAEIYVPGHTVLELLIIAVALATFALQWFAGTTRAFLEPRSRLLGASFLGVALLELVHLLVFPGMPGFLGPATIERGIWFWFAGRIWMVAALLAVFWVKPEAHSRFLHRRWLIPGVIGVVVLVVAVELSLPADRTWFYGPQGLTVLKRALEWALAAACLLGATKAARHPRALPGEAPLRKLAIAFLALGLSELCLSAYRHPYDLANMAGHLYLAAAFGFLFEALFVTALLRPYRELDALRAHVEDELVVTIRRLERMREQREDFLRAVSHDLRNPLQVVLLQADRIARAAGDAPALRGPVGAIRFAGRRMERMLRDLTDAARLEVGELRLARERVGLRAFVE